MKRKIKMVLLAMTLCLGIGLQSMGAAQASVNYEACTKCATKITRGQRAEVYRMEYLRICNEHENCRIYCITYRIFRTITFETPGCQNYNRDLDDGRNIRTEDNVHVTQ